MARAACITSAVILAGLPLFSMDWCDNMLGYRYGTKYHQPSNASEVEYRVLNFTSTSEYFLGSNFFTADMLRSDMADPAVGANGGGQGAQETFISYRTGLSLGKLLTGKKLNGRIIRDVSLTAGFDWNSKNNALGGGKFARVLGPTISFNTPRGFCDLTVAYFKEKNHNAFGNPSMSADFDATYLLNLAWALPFNVGPVSTTFKGFINHVGVKGTDPTGVDTAPETLCRTSWMWDVGALIWKRKNTLLIGPGYEYWNNKFGNPSPVTTPGGAKPNITTHCPTFQAEWHF